MPQPELASLTSDQLIDLGAELENQLDELNEELLADTGKAKSEALVKPGIKLGINTGLCAAGLALGPISLNLSFSLTTIGAAMTIWDAVDLSRVASLALRARLRNRRLRQRIAVIRTQLREIEATITSRLRPPSASL